MMANEKALIFDADYDKLSGDTQGLIDKQVRALEEERDRRIDEMEKENQKGDKK